MGRWCIEAFGQFTELAAMQTATRDHSILPFGIPLWVALLLVVASIVHMSVWFYLTRDRRVRFPAIPDGAILFDESAASGSSQTTWWTRIGGASNCLKLTVTTAEIWVRPFFLFSLLAQFSDLAHRIPRSRVIRVGELPSVCGNAVVLEYRRSNGTLCTLHLRPRERAKFLQSLSSPPPLPT